MGTADLESSISTKSIQQLQPPTEPGEKKKRLKKSPTPRRTQSRESNSATPTRSGRSLTPFSLYLIRHSTDPTDPPKWRSITPFLDRKDKEKTPFELGTDLKAQLIAHKMVFDRASVMDITDESNYEPGRFITSDAAVLDRASVMDISNVEVVYLIEEYDESQESAAAPEEETKEKKKSKRPRKPRIVTDSSEKSDSIERDLSPGGSAERKLEKKSKKKVEKKKKVKDDSDDDLSPPPSPPKLSLKLELGGGQKMNKAMFEKKAQTQPETKPPIKKTKQELEQEKAKAAAEAATDADNEKVEQEKKIKKKKKSIASIDDGDSVSIKSGKSGKRKSKSRTGSIADSASVTLSRTGSIVEGMELNDSASGSDKSSIQNEEGVILENGYVINPNVENGQNIEGQEEDGLAKENISVEKEIIKKKSKTPTPPPPPPPRRSPSPAFPPKKPETYYKKITKNFGENFSNQIRMFNTMKRDKPHHPAFIIKLKDLCVTETDNIRISCAVYGPNLSFKWFKDDIILHPSDRINFIEDENILTLEILDSRPKDTADYKLKIFNEFKVLECVSYVNVAEMGGYQDEPCPAYIESMEDYFHFIDDKLMIECKVKGIPRPKLAWYKEDMQIHEWMTEYTFVEEAHGRYILIVNHPTPQDIGVYTLHVQNDRGTHIRKHCVQFLARRPNTSSKLSYRAYRFLC